MSQAEIAAAAAIADELGKTNQITVEWKTTVTTDYQHTMPAADLAKALGITTAELFQRMRARTVLDTDAAYNAAEDVLIPLELDGAHHNHPSTDDRKVMEIRRAKYGDVPDPLPTN